MRYPISLLISFALACSFSINGFAGGKQFEEISLKAAVEQALANNLSLKLQQQNVQITKGRAYAAQGRFDARFTAEAGGQSEELTPLILGGAKKENSAGWNISTEKLFTTGTAVSLGWNNNSYDSDSPWTLFNPSYRSGLLLGISQPLLQGFGKKVQTAEIRAAEKQFQATAHQVDSEAANLAALVKRAYWNFVFTWEDIKVQELSLTLARKLLEETREKINVGKMAPVEIYQPQSEVAKREERLIFAERAIGVAEDELKLLLNSEDWLSSYRPVDKPPTEPISLDLPSILENSLQNRPDIKAADLTADAAKILEESAADRLRPNLALTGGIGLSGTDAEYGNSVNNSLSNPDNLWQMGVTFSMPLENSAAKGNLQTARARYSKSRINARLLRQQIKKTVRTAIRDVELAIKAVEATRKTSLATRKRLEAEQIKFESGRSTTLDVLIAQDAYSKALSQENLTNIAYANSLAELDRIQGLITLTSAP
ncbi:MAG: TolC family protein [Deltaproteobacteria bacterium]|nr:TolC family protein [Deltaproteobacteria bacterium]